MNQGFVKLSRKFFENPFWNEDRMFSKCEAWLDLIQSARVEQSSTIVNGKVVELQRGQQCASIRYLAKRWSWGEQKVRTYLKLLINMGMITQQQHSGETVITLVKYGVYNDSQHAEKSESNTGITQGQHRGNTGITQSIRSKEVKNVKMKEKIQPPPISEFLDYCQSQLKEKFPALKNVIELKYNSWFENDWKDGYNKPISNWKTKILNTIPYLKPEFIQKTEKPAFEQRVESVKNASDIAAAIQAEKENNKYN